MMSGRAQRRQPTRGSEFFRWAPAPAPAAGRGARRSGGANVTDVHQPMESDRERRASELLALTSIYPDELEGAPGTPWRVHIATAQAVCLLELVPPEGYPSALPPTITNLQILPSGGDAPSTLSAAHESVEERAERLCAELLSLWAGEEVVMEWIEHIRVELDRSDAAAAAAAAMDAAVACDAAAAAADAAAACDAAIAVEAASLDAAIALDAASALESAAALDDALSTAMAAAGFAPAAPAAAAAFTFTPHSSRFGQRVRHFDAGALDDSAYGVEVVSGASFHPPKSGASEAFQAHVARVRSVGEVQWVLATLLQDKRIARASHNMYAYRLTDERGVLVSDCEDDGESGSGAKLASCAFAEHRTPLSGAHSHAIMHASRISASRRLLELTRVSNVFVMVTRWFGGIHLGPARFKHIASTARLLLEETGHCGGGSKAAKPKAKK